MEWFVAFVLSLPPSPTSADLDMANAVELSVMAMDRSARPPERFRRMIDDLTNDCFAFRQKASARLQMASYGDLRWLFWGRKHRSAEVRLRCNNILRRITRCEVCGGYGYCPEYRPPNLPTEWASCTRCQRGKWNHEPHNAPPCEKCDGSGSGWHRTMFD